MQNSHSPGNDFLLKVTEIIEENISNDQFGVSELAHETGMSRSNLLRKIKKLTKLSVSQFIRQVRLTNAMELLKQNSFTVSEVSYKVGFGSTSYFIKCFRDNYGYPPGEVGKRDYTEEGPGKTARWPKTAVIVIPAVSVLLLAVVLYFIFNKPEPPEQPELEKSIAVLPFKNDSNDSTNIYFINGLMESLLNDLQKIEDLRVISRTSVEKYRNTSKGIQEIASELNVSYFVEGSGQKIGDQILLNIQLIEARTDRHLWADQYAREATDIFDLQKEISKRIIDEIEVFITPEEEELIKKIPTNNLVAYDYFLQGLEQFYQGDREGLIEAIPLFKKAIAHDVMFATAYANTAISYFFLDELQPEKEFTDSINTYADKAMLIDPQLQYSLIAKGAYYIHNEEYEVALPYMEKALENYPNSALAINILSDFYKRYMPDPEKYLEYALKGIGLDIASHDSINASYIYMHLSNAFIQFGFIQEAEEYITTSLSYNPENLYSEQIRAYLLYARHKDLKMTEEVLLQAYYRDTTRLDLIQEMGKLYYSMKDYEHALPFYRKLYSIRKKMKVDYYPGENAKIGMVFAKMGLKEESDHLFQEFKIYAENDNSAYKNLSLCVYYSWVGDRQRAIDNLRIFSENDRFNYWITLFLENDPLLEEISDHPEFHKILQVIDLKFWKDHEKIKKSLKEKKLLK